VGGFVISELLRCGFEIVAVVRDPALATILLGEQAGQVEIVTWDTDVPTISKTADVLINLAYIKTALPHRVTFENRRLVSLLRDLATTTSCPHVIHASTIAVFGTQFDGIPTPKAVSLRRDSLYAETKCQAEAWLGDAARKAGFMLSIVRLGNVIGPGSPIWTASPAQRLLEGKVIGWAGRSGPSNATYVENLARYFADLSVAPLDVLRSFGQYHHLTEFAAHRWEEVFTPMAEAIGVEQVLVRRKAGSGRASAKDAMVRYLRQFYAGRGGSYLRAGFGYLPTFGVFDRWLSRFKVSQTLGERLQDATVAADDAAFCDFVAGPVIATPHLLPAWDPPVSFAEAMSRIELWLVKAGYVVRGER
jgi:nucleoside-diphosphate-sugar epimerase